MCIAWLDELTNIPTENRNKNCYLQKNMTHIIMLSSNYSQSYIIIYMHTYIYTFVLFILNSICDN